MELNTISQPDFTSLVKIIWHKEQDTIPREAYNSGMFQIMPIPANTGDVRRISEADLELYADDKGESDQAGRARVQQGYTKDIAVKRVAKDIGVSYEMRKFNKYPEVLKMLTNLSELPVNRQELDMQHRIGFGTATTYVDKHGITQSIDCGDDFQLFYTAHTLKGSGQLYRNRLANNPQLSKGALEAMERMKIENTFNHLGEKKTMIFDKLWTTDDPNSINTALEYLKSIASPDAAHAGVTNVYKGKYVHLKTYFIYCQYL